ncbi:IS66 family insertion sequence element accessory protein TnpB [Thermodesulfobacteriota bacterium]
MREELSANRSRANSKIWLAHLKAWQKSGLSRAEYCRQHDLSYHALNYWKKKTDRRQKAAFNIVPVPAIRIAQVAAHNHPATVKVDLGRNLKIEVHDGFTPATLSQVVQVLLGC